MLGTRVVVDVTKAVWRKASRSNDQGGLCVELASLPGTVAVRDSKDPEGPMLLVSREAFRAFAVSLKK
ncbi:DUF397 domain-containing protein [Actinomadura rugatobispora]|uniref:DUF397 domain-containing protein n=1 Tax=Actinomadura rugatobispora TaxID=1994 RepID=A0ABW1A7M9_9ACTN|nr:DUF397 domain-containing protein [Actinomadura rugatobispora]